MRIETRLVKKSDKEEFIRLALERDKGIKLPTGSYSQFRKIDGNSTYWSQKFEKLVKEKRLLLGLIDKIPAGFLHFTLEFMDYPAAYVELVFVSKRSRNLGVAKQLFAEAERILANKRYSKIFSSTNPSNKISLKMHKAFGYRKCGIIYGIETPTSREIFLSKDLK